ncbi:unnamed protein product [Caenorhabditis auriculariae]|uniref:Carrier domain-containing protein n=1 Tax=Caenorhabditis auriculariae TaxID=2777116 RepID=A0A8S1HRE3_9PELO|nr:unnamed protein product [Caenorhabditis auriculariae]
MPDVTFSDCGENWKTELSEILKIPPDRITSSQDGSTFYCKVGFDNDATVEHSINDVMKALRVIIVCGVVIESIDKLMLPFVFVGELVMAVTKREENILDVEFFNFLGSLCGKIKGLRFALDIEKVVFDVLEQLKIDLKFFGRLDGFAQIGLDSLKLAILEAHIQKKVAVPLDPAFTMQCNNLDELIKYLRQKTSQKKKGEDPCKKQDEPPNFLIPLSSQQISILFMVEWAPEESDQLLEKLQFKIANLNSKKFCKCLNYLVMTHTILRTTYSKNGYQTITSATECFISTSKSKKEKESEEIIALQVDIDQDDVTLIFHHIATDGTSISILTRQLQNFYNKYNFHAPDRFPQYYDYIQQRSVDHTEEISFWKAYLGDAKSKCEIFPTDKPRSVDLSFASKSRTFEIPKPVQKALQKACVEFSSSFFETIMATLGLTLRKMIGREEIIIGTAVDLRTSSYAQTVGNFANLVPVVLRGSSDSLVEGYHKSCRDTIRLCRRHASLPFDKIVGVSDVVKTEITSPLFQILLVNDTFDVVDFDHIDSGAFFAKYDQTWYLRKGLAGYYLVAEYRGNLFHERTIDAIAQNFFRCSIATLHSLKIKDVSLFSKIEQKQKEKNIDFPLTTLLQYFLKNKHGTFKYEEQELSYVEIKLKVIQMAILIRKTFFKTYGHLPTNGNCAVIKLKRSFDLIIAVLASWKLSLFVFPISEAVPKARIEHFAQTLENPIFITDQSVEKYPYIDVTRISQRKEKNSNFHNAVMSHDLSYVTCTSGSTGTPKLVCTEFHGHANLALNYAILLKINQNSVIYQLVNPSFDIFFADLGKAVVHGASLTFASEDIVNEHELEDVTHAYIMPAYLSRCKDFSIFRSMQSIQFGGEPINQNLLKELREIKLIQEFGLTEQTVYSAYTEMSENTNTREIGPCYLNVKFVFRDVDGSLAPRDCFRAQLHLAGVGLMRGYYGAGAAADEFPTGDLVMTSSDGKRFFVGRGDSQVKLRGFRIELHEV